MDGSQGNNETQNNDEVPHDRRLDGFIPKTGTQFDFPAPGDPPPTPFPGEDILRGENANEVAGHAGHFTGLEWQQHLDLNAQVQLATQGHQHNLLDFEQPYYPGAVVFDNNIPQQQAWLHQPGQLPQLTAQHEYAGPSRAPGGIALAETPSQISEPYPCRWPCTSNHIDFMTEQQRYRHELIHWSEHRCQHCRHLFESQQSLDKHSTTCLKRLTAGQRWHCLICFKHYARSDGLARHIRTHTGTQPQRPGARTRISSTTTSQTAFGSSPLTSMPSEGSSVFSPSTTGSSVYDVDPFVFGDEASIDWEDVD